MGERRLRFRPRDGNGLMATGIGDLVEFAWLGVGEPSSETVQALSAEGVAIYVSSSDTVQFREI